MESRMVSANAESKRWREDVGVRDIYTMRVVLARKLWYWGDALIRERFTIRDAEIHV